MTLWDRVNRAFKAPLVKMVRHPDEGEEAQYLQA